MMERDRIQPHRLGEESVWPTDGGEAPAAGPLVPAPGDRGANVSSLVAVRGLRCAAANSMNPPLTNSG